MAGQYLVEHQPGAFVQNVHRTYREVETVSANACLQVGEIAVALLHPDVGKCVLELRCNAGNQGVHEKWRAADAHRAGSTVAETVDCFRCLAGGKQHGLAVVGQCAAERRGLKWPFALQKKRFAQPPFQQGQRSRNCRLRHSNRCRTLRYAASLNDRSKLNKMTLIQFHNDLLY